MDGVQVGRDNNMALLAETLPDGTTFVGEVVAFNDAASISFNADRASAQVSSYTAPLVDTGILSVQQVATTFPTISFVPAQFALPIQNDPQAQQIFQQRAAAQPAAPADTPDEGGDAAAVEGTPSPTGEAVGEADQDQQGVPEEGEPTGDDDAAGEGEPVPAPDEAAIQEARAAGEAAAEQAFAAALDEGLSPQEAAQRAGEAAESAAGEALEALGISPDDLGPEGPGFGPGGDFGIEGDAAQVAFDAGAQAGADAFAAALAQGLSPQEAARAAGEVAESASGAAFEALGISPEGFGPRGPGFGGPGFGPGGGDPFAPGFGLGFGPEFGFGFGPGPLGPGPEGPFGFGPDPLGPDGGIDFASPEQVFGAFGDIAFDLLALFDETGGEFIFADGFDPFGDPLLDSSISQALDVIFTPDITDFGTALSGTDGDDTITGTDLNDSLFGGDGNDTINGGAGSDAIFGENGNDNLTGGDGSDSVNGGPGNDVIAFDLLDILSGGTGEDTLNFTGSGEALDLTSTPTSQINGFEIIDLTGSGSNNVLTVSAASIITQSDTDIVRVDGGSTDSVQTTDSDWVNGGDVVINGVTYTQYTNSGATLQVATAVNQTNINTSSSSGGQLSINDVSVSEDGGTAVFTVSRTIDTTGAATVNFATADNTAIAGSDYTAISGTVSFAAGDTTQQISVAITDDSNAESDETFFVNLSNASGATISDSQGIGTITDNDPAGPTISIDDPSVSESDSSASLEFKITLSSSSATTVTVTFSTSDGTATGGLSFTPPTDYIEVTSQTVTFNPGDTEESVFVSIVGDTTTEPNETFFGNLSGVSSNATIADNQGTATILNDDSFFIDDATADEDAGTMTFTVTRSGQPTTTATVDFATADGTAIAGLDYLAASGTLVFVPGETEKTVTVTILDDALFEAAESFTVNLSNAIGDNIKDGEGVGTIVGNDLAAALAALAGSEGFDPAAAAAEESLNPAGDVNGDGLADVIVGAPYARAGEGYVVFSTANVDSGFDLSTLDGTKGFLLNGGDASAVSDISGVGDVNGDGTDDLLVSAVDLGGNGLGPVAVVFGGLDIGAGGEVNLSTLASGDGLVLGTIDGTEGADTLIGSAAAESIAGGLGNDILVGGGGLDVLRGGDGDDIIVIADTGFVRADGGAETSGSGGDTLRLAGGDLDLTAIANSRIEGIETIDLSASSSGANALTLQLSDVLDISETSNTLVIVGDTLQGDTVATPSEAWSAAGTQLVNGEAFNAFTLGNGTLLVDPLIDTTNITGT